MGAKRKFISTIFCNEKRDRFKAESFLFEQDIPKRITHHFLWFVSLTFLSFKNLTKITIQRDLKLHQAINSFAIIILNRRYLALTFVPVSVQKLRAKR